MDILSPIEITVVYHTGIELSEWATHKLTPFPCRDFKGKHFTKASPGEADVI